MLLGSVGSAFFALYQTIISIEQLPYTVFLQEKIRKSIFLQKIFKRWCHYGAFEEDGDVSAVNRLRYNVDMQRRGGDVRFDESGFF
jgi:hypothetical protein